MGVDVCYIVSHGFAARMLLQTNLVGKLTEQGLRVGIVSHDTSDPNMQALAENPNVELVQWQSKSTIWDDDYLYKRMYFLENINANPALKEKFYNALFYSKSKHPWKRIRPLYYYLIFLLAQRFPGIRKRFLAREGKHLQSQEASALLDQLNPKLVVSTYPVAIIEAKLLYEAKQRGMATTLHLLSWDNITAKGQFPAMAEKFLVWGNIMKEELQAHYGIPESDITTCGVPHFDAHVRIREAGTTSKVVEALGLSSNQPYLFVAMSSPRFAPREIDIVEWLASAVNRSAFGATMQLIVRPHPQNVTEFTAKGSWLHRLDKLAGARVGIDYPKLNKSNIRWSMQQNDMVHLSELIAGCTVCLNSGSTVSIDALMHNKPVILTSFDGTASIPYWNSARRLVDYTHLKKLVSSGGVHSVRSYAELETSINTFIENPNHDLELRRTTLLEQCYKDDGMATQRVVEALQQHVVTLTNA